MSYNFYVMQGKKFIDYKPTTEHYERAFCKLVKKSLEKDIDTIIDDKDGKLLFLLIKVIGRNKGNLRNKDKETVEYVYILSELVCDIVKRKTPRQFMQFFPLDKEYDGGEDWKDYYYCINSINEMGMDEPIGENVYKFLMDYQNWDVVKFAVAKMILISEISKIRTGVDPMDAFFDEMGIKTKTMYRDGDYMIDSETWERYEIKKSEKPLKKLFSVMD